MEISKGLSNEWYFIELTRKHSYYTVMVHRTFDHPVGAMAAFKACGPELVEYVTDKYDAGFLREKDGGQDYGHLLDRFKEASDDAYYGYALLKKEDYENKPLLAILTMAPSCIYKRLLNKFPTCCKTRKTCDHSQQGIYLYDKLQQ